MMPAAIRPDGLREVAPGVFYGSGQPMLADRVSIDFLKQQAGLSGMRRARICGHPDPEARQHDMLIACQRDTYVAPHLHQSKSESFLVLEGEADMLIFEDDGRLTARIPMGSIEAGRPFFYRVPAGQYHSLDIRSDALVFAECSLGPFRCDDMERVLWAPPPQERNAGRRYIATL
jgi:cupin fold WbuC family metalloprotein